MATEDDLRTELDNALRQYHEVRRTYKAVLKELTDTKAALAKALKTIDELNQAAIDQEFGQ